jgi:hypothetical protein
MSAPSVPVPVNIDQLLSYSQWLGALCLWREARGSSIAALTAIWHVINNRMNDPAHRWSRSIPGVILQHAQFSSFNAGDPNAVKFPVPPPTGTFASADWKAFADCVSVVTAKSDDPTKGANGYESLPVESTKPSWCQPDKITLTLGPFRFYRL